MWFIFQLVSRSRVLYKNWYSKTPIYRALILRQPRFTAIGLIVIMYNVNKQNPDLQKLYPFHQTPRWIWVLLYLSRYKYIKDRPRFRFSGDLFFLKKFTWSNIWSNFYSAIWVWFLFYMRQVIYRIIIDTINVCHEGVII